MLIRLDLAAPHRDLLRIGSRQLHGSALRLDLPVQGGHLRRGRVGGRPRLIELLGRDHAALAQVLRAGERQVGVLEIGGGGRHLRLGGGERRLGLSNLIDGLTLLKPQGRFRFADL